MPRPCAHCGKEMSAERVERFKRVRFCSRACSNNSRVSEYAGGKSVPGLSTTAIGAVSEMLAAATPDRPVVTVQVRTGHTTASGEVTYGRKITDKQDHYAVVVYGQGRTHRVLYFPALPGDE